MLGESVNGGQCGSIFGRSEKPQLQRIEANHPPQVLLQGDCNREDATHSLMAGDWIKLNHIRNLRIFKNDKPIYIFK